MRFPSVCCEYVLLPLVNKEAAWPMARADDSQAGILNRDIYRERRQSGEDAM